MTPTHPNPSRPSRPLGEPHHPVRRRKGGWPNEEDDLPVVHFGAELILGPPNLAVAGDHKHHHSRALDGAYRTVKYGIEYYGPTATSFHGVSRSIPLLEAPLAYGIKYACFRNMLKSNRTIAGNADDRTWV